MTAMKGFQGTREQAQSASEAVTVYVVPWYEQEEGWNPVYCGLSVHRTPECAAAYADRRTEETAKRSPDVIAIEQHYPDRNQDGSLSYRTFTMTDTNVTGELEGSEIELHENFRRRFDDLEQGGGIFYAPCSPTPAVLQTIIASLRRATAERSVAAPCLTLLPERGLIP